MKKTILAMVALATVTSAVWAQKETAYKKMYYKDTKVENNDVVITIDNAVSTEGETKMKLKITNKTNNYIVYKPEESKFVVDGKEIAPQDKWLYIAPFESESRVVNIKGPGYNKIKNYSLAVDGLYKVVTETPLSAPEFKLPPSQNDFAVGDFKCSLKKLSKETDKAAAKFYCKYTGDKIAIVDPSKSAVRMPDGKDYASKASTGMFAKGKPILMKKGDEEAFTLDWDRMQGGKEMDMQKVDMFIKWNETFTEGHTEKMKSETVQLEFDEATSNAKGK